jgi:ClpP class serine protease
MAKAKDTAEKVRKSDAELEKAFVERTKKAIRNVDKWTAKVEKYACASRRKLTDEQKTKVKSYMDEVYSRFTDSMAGRQESKTEFDL